MVALTMLVQVQVEQAGQVQVQVRVKQAGQVEVQMRVEQAGQVMVGQAGPIVGLGR